VTSPPPLVELVVDVPPVPPPPAEVVEDEPPSPEDDERPVELDEQLQSVVAPTSTMKEPASSERAIRDTSEKERCAAVLRARENLKPRSTPRRRDRRSCLRDVSSRR
jgi:hypothetical protein